MSALLYQVIWRQVGFDGTGKDGKDFVNCNILVVDKETKKEKTICLRGAFLTDNKTAECEAQGIKEKVFKFGQGLLQGWIETFEEMFPGEECTIPKPKTYRLARLAAGSSVVSDGCNQALKMQRLVKQLIIEDFIEQVGREVWDSMTVAERDEAVRVHLVTCQNHLRSTMISWGVKAEKNFMQEALDLTLEHIDRDLRVSLDTQQICRAAAKEFLFSGQDLYAKGKAASFLGWAIHKHPDRSVYVLYRADLGTRFDSATECALALYMNRGLYVEFLAERIAAGVEDNKLESALYTALTCKEIVAAVRTRAAIDIKITKPLRFLTNSSDINNCPTDMGQVVDALETFLKELEGNGSKLFDINMDIFRDNISNEDADTYLLWKKDSDDRLGTSIGGTVKKIPIWRLAKNEVFEPGDPTNKSTDAFVVQIAQTWATGMLKGMHNTPQKEYLSSEGGCFSESKVTDQMREDLAASATVNDMSERIFAHFDRVKEQNPGIGLANASAKAAEKVNHHVVPAKPPTAGKRTGSAGEKVNPRSPGALLDELPRNEAVALFEFARKGKSEYKRMDKDDVQSQLASHYQAFQEQAKKKLDITARKYGRALLFHGLSRITDIKTFRTQLRDAPSDGKRLELCRQQLNLVVIGYGWVEHKTPWSCATDKTVGSLPDLITNVEAMITKSGKRPKPDEPPVPDAATKRLDDLCALGTPSLQIVELMQKKKANASEWREHAEQLRAEQKAAEAEKETAKQDAFSKAQPAEAPTVEVGMHLEVLTLITEEDEHGNQNEYKQWLSVAVISATSDLTGSGKGDPPSYLPRPNPLAAVPNSTHSLFG